MERIIAVLEDKSIGAPSETGRSNKRTQTVVRTSPDKIRYDLYLTDRRIVVAVVFSQADTSRSGEVQTMGQSLESSWASMNFAKIRDQRRKESEGRTPDEILGMHRDSFEVPLGQIRSIELKKGMMGTRLEFETVVFDKVEKLGAKVPKELVGDVSAFLDLCPPGAVVR